MSVSEDGTPPDKPDSRDFVLERYKYILQQINAVNENVHRFLAIYQTLAVALVSGGLALFVGYRKWGIAASVARAGVTTGSAKSSASLMWSLSHSGR